MLSRRIRRSVFLVLGFLLLPLGIQGQERDEILPLQRHSVWRGFLNQENKNPYPVILYVRERGENVFEGTTWYPTYDNGLLAVSGRIERGKIHFTEVRAIS